MTKRPGVRVTQMFPNAGHQHVACLIVGSGIGADCVETLTADEVDDLIERLRECKARAARARFSA